MLFTNRAVRVLFEAVEGAGFSREELTRPLGLAADELIAKGRSIEWSTMVGLGKQLAHLLGDDDDRLRVMGRQMLHTRPLGPLQAIAKSAVSVRGLYEISVRWVFTAILPHLKVSLSAISPTRLRVHCEIPEPFEEHRTFFVLFEGAVVAMPEFLGHPPAVIIESKRTARAIDVVIEYQDRPPLLARAGRRVRALLATKETLAALETQRAELAENIRALQQARDELRLVLERLPDFVAIHAEGKILWVNEAFVRGLGYADRTELVGRSVLDVVAPQERVRVESGLRRGLYAPDPALAQWVLRTKSGEELTVESAPVQSVVFDGVAARLSVVRDVSERLRMQQQLIVADRLASVGLLAAGVAHEVNNPLGYVLNNIELAAKNVSSDPEAVEMRRKVLGIALEGVDRIRVTVRDLLMLSRGDDGPPLAIDVVAIASSTLALAATEVERRGRLVCDFGPAPQVLASGARISQVLLNLVGNALEAMSHRPKHESELVVRIQTAVDGRLVLEVADNGKGIPAADVDRVFEPFYTTKPAGHGTGLGLAIAQKIVVELGGEISASSVLGRGTTFRVLLPAAPADAVAVASSA